MTNKNTLSKKTKSTNQQAFNVKGDVFVGRHRCSNCNGDGWYTDHSDRHYATGNSKTCEQACCPIQRQCEKCYGQGWI